jgi:IS5 family transposase
LEVAVANRLIGQERLGFASETSSASSLDGLSGMLDWTEIADLLSGIHTNAKGEAAWPPLAMFKALLLSVWYDLSDIKLAEALDDRASFRWFCGFSSTEATPEHTAFVRFRKALMRCPKIPVRSLPTVHSEEAISAMLSAPKAGTRAQVS